MSGAITFLAFLAIGILVLLLVVFFWGVSIYNRLVGLRNRYKNAFAQIDVQLKRRYDLIPNLVESAKGYMRHEAGTLEAVVAARSGAVSAAQAAARNPGDATAMRQLGAAEGVLNRSLGQIFALAESYPELKANETIAGLMEELGSTENRLAFARQAFNDAVMQYNTEGEQFPGSIIAGAFRFLPAELLESIEAPEERKAPKVSFG